MYANTCWGLLGLAVTFGLAVLGLPQDYLWLQPHFVWTAVACGIVSLLCFLWPLLRRAMHRKAKSAPSTRAENTASLPATTMPAIAPAESAALQLIATLRLFDNGETTKVVHQRGVKSVNFERDNLMGLLVVRCSIDSAPAEIIDVTVSAFVRGEKVQAPFEVHENSDGYIALKIITVMSPVRITDFSKTDDKGIELNIDYYLKKDRP